MPEMTAHPSREQLIAYNLGQLPPDEADTIESHINECEPCCDTIVSLSSDDTFVGLLKEARQLPTDQTVDHGVATHSSLCQDIPVQLAEHPRYEIVGLIGKGGMGDVYKARHRKMERTVALKVINRGLIRKAEAIGRFHREVKAAAQLSHPNIVTAHDADQAGDFHFMVMEYVDGVDLSQTVKDRGALPVAEACDYIQQAAIGLQHAHECSMVHRDIKPHNLMVTKDGTVKVLDFGLASLAPEVRVDAEVVAARGDLTTAGAIMGTPDFISPEQAEDARQADIRSDIYSLEATLYFLLTGRPPFAEGSVMHKVKSHAHIEPDFEFETNNFEVRRNGQIACKVDLVEGEVVVSKDGKPFDQGRLSLADRATVAAASWRNLFPIQVEAEYLEGRLVEFGELDDRRTEVREKYGPQVEELRQRLLDRQGECQKLPFFQKVNRAQQEYAEDLLSVKPFEIQRGHAWRADGPQFVIWFPPNAPPVVDLSSEEGTLEVLIVDEETGALHLEREHIQCGGKAVLPWPDNPQGNLYWLRPVQRHAHE